MEGEEGQEDAGNPAVNQPEGGEFENGLHAQD